MTTKMDYDKRKVLFNSIPSSFVVQGYTITTHKRYANQFNPDELTTGPTITLEYPEVERGFQLPLNKVRSVDTYRIEEHTYTGVTTLFNMSFKFPDTRMMAVDYIEAIVGGVTIVIPPVNYVRKLNGLSILDSTPANQIDFIGPIYPDVGTSFTIKFNVQWVIVTLGGEFTDSLSINVYAIDSVSPSIHGTVLAMEISRQVRELFQFGLNISDIVIEEVSPIKDLDSLQAVIDYSRRRQFNCQLRYTVAREVVYENIGEVDYNIEVET